MDPGGEPKTLVEMQMEALAPFNQMLDDFVRAVFACGFKPSDCLHKTIQEHGGNTAVDVIEVLGVPCFEVKTERRYDADTMTLHLRYTPRILNPLPPRPEP